MTKIAVFLLLACLATRVVAQEQHVTLPNDFYKRILAREQEELFRHPASEEALRHTNTPLSSDNDRSITPDGVPESEIHAAINPMDSSNIVVSAMRQKSFTTGNALNFPIYYTKDFGKTWNLSSFKPGPFEKNTFSLGGGDPMFAFDADGKLYFMWLSIYSVNLSDRMMRYGMYWASSTDGGETWTRDTSNVIEWNASTDPMALIMPDKEWMAIDRGNTPWHNNVYVAYAYVDAEHAVVQVLRKRPQDKNFSVTATVSSPDLAFAQWTTIGVERNGDVHVVFTGTSDTVNYALYHVVSHDGGSIFSPEQSVTPIHLWWPPRKPDEDSIVGLRHSDNYPCSHLAIDTAHDGNMYLVWSSTGVHVNEHHGSQIYFTRSTDHGTTWSPLTTLTDDGLAHYTHHFYPSIAINKNGALSASWYDRRDDPNNLLTNYYCAISTNAGLSWGKNVRVSSAPTDFATTGEKNDLFSIGEYTQLLTTDHCLIPIWTDGRTQDGSLKIYYAIQPLDASAAVQMAPITDEFALLDISPNPAKNHVTIRYRLKNASPISLTLVDASGKAVRTLSETTIASGEHSTTMELSGLPTGGYFLRIQTNVGTATRAISIVQH